MRKEVKHMTHLKTVSKQLPVRAIGWPESHTWEFFRNNLPGSVYALVELIIDHVKALAPTPGR